MLLSLVTSFSAFPKTVTLLELNWSSQQVLTHVLDLLFKRQNIESELFEGSSSGQWFYLNAGKADIQVEVWEGSMSKPLKTMLEMNRAEVAAEHNLTSREGWWYPLFAKKLCPGLPSWKALANCPGVFTDASGTETYYAGPWDKPEQAKMRAFELPFQVTQLENTQEINKKIIESMEQNKPILIFNWSPNWIWQVYDGEFVELPDFDERCETDASWGVNPHRPWDCDNPKTGWIKSVVSSSLKEKSPCALAITKSFVMDAEDLSYAAYLTDVEKLSVRDAAEKWLIENTTRVNDWIAHPECLDANE
ncbi:glycine betaine ABC transporter substrate-binding protein [Vibrio sp. HN007]|uniref:glycine betaine ABC transporter substrate-binding protein n=1 Tax=Vibrio iocasae TaxID=3098914 RepID=UPI0035D3DD2A